MLKMVNFTLHICYQIFLKTVSKILRIEEDQETNNNNNVVIKHGQEHLALSQGL